MSSVTRREINQLVSDGWHIERETNSDNGSVKVMLSRRELTAAGYAKRGTYAVTVVPVTAVLSATAVASYVLSGLYCFPVGVSRGWNPFSCCVPDDPDSGQARGYNQRHAIENKPKEFAETILLGGEYGYHELLWNDDDYERVYRTLTVREKPKSS